MRDYDKNPLIIKSYERYTQIAFTVSAFFMAYPIIISLDFISDIYKSFNIYPSYLFQTRNSNIHLDIGYIKYIFVFIGILYFVFFNYILAKDIKASIKFTNNYIEFLDNDVSKKIIDIKFDNIANSISPYAFSHIKQKQYKRTKEEIMYYYFAILMFIFFSFISNGIIAIFIFVVLIYISFGVIIFNFLFYLFVNLRGFRIFPYND